MAHNLTPTNIKKVKDLLEIANNNVPGSTTWSDAETKLNDLFWSFWECEPPKSIRLKYYNSGIYESIISIIQADIGRHTNYVLDNVWSLVE
jgi:hypothetical protein